MPTMKAHCLRPKLCRGCGKYFDETVGHEVEAHAGHPPNGRIGVVIYEGRYAKDMAPRI